MTVQTHKTTTRTADLDSDFGYQLAVKKLGVTIAQLESLLGKYVKGKNTGKFKGCLVWDKTEIGGWDYGTQSVKLPGSRNYRICTKTWLGGGWGYDTVYSQDNIKPVVTIDEYEFEIKINDSWNDNLGSYISDTTNSYTIADEYNQKYAGCLNHKILPTDVRLKLV